MTFNKLFYETIKTDINKLDEYVSGQLEDKIFGVLKDNGFDCESTKDEVHEFLSSTSKTLRSRDIEELVVSFFDGNCTRHLLQKMFGKKRK